MTLRDLGEGDLCPESIIEKYVYCIAKSYLFFLIKGVAGLCRDIVHCALWIEVL
jgi:hypothetical protein